MPPTSNLPIDNTLEILRKHITDSTLLNAVVKDLIATQKEIAKEKLAEAEANKGLKIKSRYTVIIRADPSESAKLKSLVGAGAYVLTTPDDATTDTYTGDNLLKRIYSAARYWNDNLKRKRGSRVIKTFVSALETLKPKTIKESGSEFKIKASYPAEVVVVDIEGIPSQS